MNHDAMTGQRLDGLIEPLNGFPAEMEHLPVCRPSKNVDVSITRTRRD
jgi:hypothetical protein